jgi:hypothetical protein
LNHNGAIHAIGSLLPASDTIDLKYRDYRAGQRW